MVVAMGGTGTGDVRSPLVLIVDDDFDILDALTDALGELGFRTATAANGAAALTWLRQATAPPAVILLDLMMPEMDGEAVARTVRADPALRNTPIVILSASRDSDAIAADVRAAGVVEKPIRLLMLHEALGRAIEDRVRNTNR
jgi:CheY-like chemotaxis protein